MKKKLLLLLLAIVFPLAGFAADGDVFSCQYKGLTFYFRVISESEKTCQVGQMFSGEYSGESKAIDLDLNVAVEIPESANGYKVTEIGINAFAGSKMSSITFPSTVQKIGKYAFTNCTNLTSLSIPDAITEIGYYAFSGCTGITLESLTISKNVEKMGPNPFYGWTNLKEIKVSSDNKFFDSRNNCNAIIQTDNNMLVTGCNTTVIPSTVTSIGEGAFARCSFKSIELPNSIEYIFAWAFRECSQLESITFPERMTNLSSSDVFTGCVNLKTVEFSSGTTIIGAFFFGGCTSLESITLPKNLKEITPHAFYNCTNLKTIKSYIKDPENFNKERTEAERLVAFPYVNENVFIPETLYVPYGTANSYKSQPEWKNFPNIIEMAEGEDMPAIGDIIMAKTNEEVDMRFKVTSVINNTCEVAEKDENGEYCAAISADYEGSISIPDNVQGYRVTGIASNAFNQCKFSSILLPSSISSIAPYALSNWNLKEIISEITNPFAFSEEDNPFGYDNIMVNGILRVPEGTKSLYMQTDGWKNFKNIFSGNEGKTVVSPTKEGVDVLYTITGDENLKECQIGYLFPDYKSFAVDRDNVSGDITIPQSITFNQVEYKVKKVGDRAFSDMDGVNVTFSEGLEEVGADAFKGTINSSVLLPASVSCIKEGAFSICPGLTLEVRSLSPIAISEDVFDGIGDYNVKSYLRVPVGAKEAYATATGWNKFSRDCIFQGNEGTIFTAKTAEDYDMIFTILSDEGETKECQVGYLTGDYEHTAVDLDKVEDATIVTIPEKVEGYTVVGIGDSSFESLNFTKISIPQTVKSIGNNAFSYCGLVSFELPKNIITLGKEFLTGCNNLNSLTVEDGNEIFDSRDNCNAIIQKTSKKLIAGCKKTTIPTSAETIGEYAFCGLRNLSITIPKSVKEIEKYAFLNNRGLNLIVEAETPISIDESVFRYINEYSIKSTLRVPDGAKDAYLAATGWNQFGADYILSGNDGTTFTAATTEGVEVTYTILDDEAKTCLVGYLDGNYDKKAADTRFIEGKLTIPGNVNGYTVVKIGKHAFQNAYKMTEVDIPSTVTAIDELAFSECSSLTSFIVKKNLISLSEKAFCRFNNLETVTVETGNSVYESPEGSNVVMESATKKVITGAKDFIIPAEATMIADWAFPHRHNANISIPASITAIGEYAFGWISSSTITVEWERPIEIGDRVFSGVNEEDDEKCTLVVPDGTKEAYLAATGWSQFGADYIIEASEFNKVVTVDDAVYQLDEEGSVTFVGVDKSKAVGDFVIPGSITVDDVEVPVKEIAPNAFEDCTGLVSVTIPANIQVIGDAAFKGCTGLEEIYCLSSVPIDLSKVFASRTRVMLTRSGEVITQFEGIDFETCILYVPAGSKKLYEQAEGWKQFKNIVEMGETAAITIGKAGKASYCGDKSLDFSFSDEVKAYIATGFDKDEGTIWLTRVKDVPAGVPVLIKGNANTTYDVPVTDSENSYYTNMFVGNTSGDKIQIQETDGDMVNYYLSGDGTFKSVNKSANIGNNKCYLQLPGTFEAAVTGVTQTVKIGSIGKASFAAPVDLDFTNVSGLKAFTATGYDKSTKTIWLTRVMKVQKGEGVLLKGDPNSYEIPSAAVQSSYENMFVGNTSGNEIQVLETSEDGSQTNYYLKGDGSFVSVNGYVNIKNNKCYLALPTSMVAVSSTRSAEDDYKFEEPEVIKLPIDFKSIGSEGDGTTGVKEVKSGEAKGDEWYTLQGQRVAKPGKGLYIKNGKKVVIK